MKSEASLQVPGIRGPPLQTQTFGTWRQREALLGVSIGYVNRDEPVMSHDTRRNYFLSHKE
jgi:hypothetical protein